MFLEKILGTCHNLFFLWVHRSMFADCWNKRSDYRTKTHLCQLGLSAWNPVHFFQENHLATKVCVVQRRVHSIWSRKEIAWNHTVKIHKTWKYICIHYNTMEKIKFAQSLIMQWIVGSDNDTPSTNMFLAKLILLHVQCAFTVN